MSDPRLEAVKAAAVAVQQSDPHSEDAEAARFLAMLDAALGIDASSVDWSNYVKPDEVASLSEPPQPEAPSEPQAPAEPLPEPPAPAAPPAETDEHPAEAGDEE